MLLSPRDHWQSLQELGRLMAESSRGITHRCASCAHWNHLVGICIPQLAMGVPWTGSASSPVGPHIKHFTRSGSNATIFSSFQLSQRSLPARVSNGERGRNRAAHLREERW